MRTAILFALLINTTISNAQLGDPNDVELRLKTYADLNYPPSLQKSEVQWMVQTAADQLHGRYYVDLGDLSDFMHGHLLEKDGSPLLILFHTKEFTSRRHGVPYEGTNGPLDPYSDRNFILWLKDSHLGKRGEMVHAHEYSNFPDKLTTPVSNKDLRADLFGDYEEVRDSSVYFFRVRCEDVDAQQLSSEETKRSNLIEVQQKGERVCLALMDFECRNHWTSQKCSQYPKLDRYVPEWDRSRTRDLIAQSSQELTP